jgi:glycosyltransferase involved in cell wall biosynthesis
MNILINCSNIKIGGGIQVALSFLDELVDKKGDNYLIVVSTVLKKQLETQKFSDNFVYYYYDIKSTPINAFWGHNYFLDSLVEKHKIQKVFTVFGPSYWRPKIDHICGFAKPHYIYKDSPFFNVITLKHKFQLKLKEFFHLWDFRQNADILITENEDVSQKLEKLVNKKVYTVTNTYNQIFDTPESWRQKSLPLFEGKYLLTITANYPHKNLQIIPLVIEELLKRNIKKFKFVVSLNKGDIKNSNEILDKFILYLGKVEVKECPSLYAQCDYLFLPTLLECFSASYPEAMFMKKPILTSDLYFAHSICGEAATYFNPIDPVDVTNNILMLDRSNELQNRQIEVGLSKLQTFDSAEHRAIKYLDIIKNK